MNEKNELWAIKKIDYFPGIEFKENLYVGFKEDTVTTYQKIIENLKEKNYEIEEVEFLETIGFKIDKSFIYTKPIKNKKNEKIIQEIIDKI